MLPSFCRETVEVTRATLRRLRGTSERDWADAETHAVAGCMVSPASTSDDVNNARPGLSLSATLYAPPGADIAAQDRVKCRLGLFRVVGEPMAVESPTGRLSHVRCDLERREG